MDNFLGNEEVRLKKINLGSCELAADWLIYKLESDLSAKIEDRETLKKDIVDFLKNSWKKVGAGVICTAPSFLEKTGKNSLNELLKKHKIISAVEGNIISITVRGGEVVVSDGFASARKKVSKDGEKFVYTYTNMARQWNF